MFIYGQNSQGEFVHIADSPKGNAAALSCLYCSAKLTAKKGDIIAHHFAHQKDQGETCRGASSTFQKIVFGFDYYDFALTGSEKKALHLLTNLCTDKTNSAGYILSEFFWHAPLSAKYQLYKHSISSRSKSDAIVDKLVEEGFFTRTYDKVPVEYDSVSGLRIDNQKFPSSINANAHLLRPTEKALAFCLKLPLYRFIKVLQNWWTELEDKLTNDQEKQLLAIHKIRMAQNRLYFLAITAGWNSSLVFSGRSIEFLSNGQLNRQREEDSDVTWGKRPIYKIGITTRPIEERVTEIRQYLIKHWCPKPTIEVLHIWDGGAALVELYFKKKYLSQRWPVGNATEYFYLYDHQLQDLRRDFHQFTLRTSAHKEKIRQALAVNKENRAGRSKETSDKFINKPHVQQIIQLLTTTQNSLREVSRLTGASINTVRKVNQQLTQEPALKSKSRA